MTALEKFERFNHKASMAIEWVGLVAFLLMMFITTADVLGAKLFLRPVPGSIDIMMLSQLVCMTFSAAAALILGRHVQVEFFVLLLPKRAREIVNCIVFLLGLLLFAIIVWRLAIYSYGLQVSNEVSSTIRLPLYPFGYGAAFASISVCLVYLSLFLESLLKVVKK